MTKLIDHNEQQTDKHSANIRQAIGILNNRIIVLEKRNRSLDALVRRLSIELNQLKILVTTRSRGE